jgi:hypothetical protein
MNQDAPGQQNKNISQGSTFLRKKDLWPNYPFVTNNPTDCCTKKPLSQSYNRKLA